MTTETTKLEGDEIKRMLEGLRHKLRLNKEESTKLKEDIGELVDLCESQGHEHIETDERGSGWMSFDDPRHGPSMGHRTYTFWECKICGDRKAVCH